MSSKAYVNDIKNLSKWSIFFGPGTPNMMSASVSIGLEQFTDKKDIDANIAGRTLTLKLHI